MEVRAQDNRDQFQKIRAIIQQKCLSCHGKEKQEGDLRLDRLNPDMVKGVDAETWHDVLNRINRGEMPPEKAEALQREERHQFVDWLNAELKRAEKSRRGKTDGVVMRRLTRYEYQNTMRDLLGIELDFSAELPPESTSEDGFQNNGETLGISPLQIEFYLRAARTALNKVIVEGEAPKVCRTYVVVKPLPKVDPSAKKKKRPKGGKNDRLLADSNSYYQIKANEFPREGEVIVRVEAFAEVPHDHGFPQLAVSMGVKADTRSPEKIVDIVDVTGSENDPQVIEFRARIEEFPLPGHKPKFPGLAINLRNVYGGSFAPIGRNARKGKSIENGPAIVLKSVEFTGPVYDSWPPPNHQAILFPFKKDVDDEAYLAEVLRRFMRKAYRRAITADDLQVAINYFQRVRPNCESFTEAVRETLAMILISPEFLYLVESRSDNSQALNDYELASRLSYFLWSTMPDDELLKLAEQRKLREPNVLKGQVKRMISDERSFEFIRHFSDQWLDLSGVDRVAINPSYYPDFDDYLKQDMQLETQHFIAEILHKNLNAMNMLDSDFVMVNRAMAIHYGLDPPGGNAFQRINIKPGDHRGGLLTQASMLLRNSNGEDSHPIRRAVWVLERVLDSPPPPPPPDVPELDSSQSKLAKLSLKERLELHSEKEACRDCHQNIDPWGIAFENFDAVGKWRSEVRDRRKTVKVDAQAELKNGTRIEGIDGLKNYLLEHEQDRFAKALVKKMLTYSLGRSLQLSDQATVEELNLGFQKNEYRLQELIQAIVLSQSFQTK